MPPLLSESSKSHSQELSSTLLQLRGDIGKVRTKCDDLVQKLQDGDLPTENGMSYMEMKHQLLLNYCSHLTFYCLLKTGAPEDVPSHPVFEELVRIRTVLERLRPLDTKLKYQIEKLLKMANSEHTGVEQEDVLAYAPNPDALVSKLPEESEETKSDGVYKAPKLAAVHFEEEEKSSIKKAKLEEQKQKKTSKSKLLAEIREEFSERPVELMASGQALIDKAFAHEDAEKQDYEESRFVRLVTSRKDKIRRRQKERDAMKIDTVTDIDKFSNISHLMDINKEPTISRTKKSNKRGGIFAHVDIEETKKKKKNTNLTNSNQVNNKDSKLPTFQKTNKKNNRKAPVKQKVVFSLG